MTKSNDTIGKTWSDEDLAAMDTNISTDSLEIKRNPIGEFTDRKRDTRRADAYVKALESVLLEYEAFLHDTFEQHPCNVTDDHIKSFNEHLKNGVKYVMQNQGWRDKNPENTAVFDINCRTREEYLNHVISFYNWLEGEGVVSENPGKKAVTDLRERSEFDRTDPDRPKIELDEIQDFLQWLSTPFQRAFIILVLKTAARHGEAGNIDLCDLHLEHPLYDWYLDTYNIELVKDVKNRPDSLYIQPGFQKGTVIRGEKRRFGQKRKREDGTVVPIDKELKTALLEYLLTRRPPRQGDSCHPLFIMMNNVDVERTLRATNNTIGTQILKNAFGEYGWYESGAATENNVDIHYLRHYFTHNHRHMSGVYNGHMPEGVIAYVRGDADSGDTARETTYAHGHWDDWNKTVKEPYLNGIYQFGVYD